MFLLNVYYVVHILEHLLRTPSNSVHNNHLFSYFFLICTLRLSFLTVMKRFYGLQL